jgi:hypothetical protein
MTLLAAAFVTMTLSWAPLAHAQPLELSRAGSQASSTGPAETFTGHVVVTPLYAANEARRGAAASSDTSIPA